VLENDKYAPTDPKQLIMVIFFIVCHIYKFMTYRDISVPFVHIFTFRRCQNRKKITVNLNDTGTFENNLVVWLGQIFIFYPPVTIIYTVSKAYCIAECFSLNITELSLGR